MAVTMRKAASGRMGRAQRGTSYVEYFVLALIVAIATIVFYQGEQFAGARQQVEQAFDQAVERILAP